MRVASALFVAIACCVVSADSALAASVSVKALGSGRDPTAIWYVVYEAGPGERNLLKVGTFGATLQLDDSGAVIRAGAGCVSIDEHEAKCTGPSDDVLMYVDAGDQNDYVFGSLHRDVIHGGPGDDLLDGGPGLDEVHGDDGNDIVRTRDNDRVSGGGGYDEIRLNPDLPLGDPDDKWFRTAGPFLCSGGIVTRARAGAEVRSCDRVSYGPADTAASPRFTGKHARFTLACPTPKNAGRGHCTGRIQVGGRRHGEARFDIPAGSRDTVSVPLHPGRRQTALYGFVISGTGRYLFRRYPLRASWSINISYYLRRPPTSRSPSSLEVAHS